MNVWQEMVLKNSAQMAAGVVSFQIYEGTRHLLCSLGWSSRRKVFHFTSSSYFNCIPFTKELEKSTRKFFQPLLIHTSNRSVNYLVFVSFFGKGGKMVNRCSRHAFVERITLIQGYPKATSLRFDYGLLWVVSSCSIKPSKKSVSHQVTLFDIPATVQQYSNTETELFNLLNVDFNLILSILIFSPKVHGSRSDMPAEVTTKEIKTRIPVVQIVNCTHWAILAFSWVQYK